jgi:outer membrane protein assembly factor BamA
MRQLLVIACLAVVARGQCANDQRSEKRGGIVVSDFTITGTTTLSSPELEQLTGSFVGSCYNDDTEELQERLRAAFQDRGYFTVEVKSLSLKPGDPLGAPKPVAVEAEVAEGARYKVAGISFLKNQAFSEETLRQEFPLKKGDVFKREKVVSGLASLRKLYGSNGFLDYTAIPDVEPSSNGTMTLTVTVDEGPQYHMGKLEILAGREIAARLRTEWKMTEGSVYDNTYARKFVEENHRLLPDGFTAEDVRQVSNCPAAAVEVSMVIDPQEGTPGPPTKNIPCESGHDQK